MTRELSLDDAQWSRLEELWERACALPPDEREALLASETSDPALRAELESLLERSDAAEAFFARLRRVASQDEHGRLATPVGEAKNGLGAAAPDEDPRTGTTVAHYHIAERLGQGGMGVVYRATDLRLRRAVAIKLLRSHAPNDHAARERMLGEARAAAALDHPNICTIYEVGETPELSFIAMAFYPGETLAQALGRGHLPVPRAVDYALQIARGLRVAHSGGIVHRDVKPANIVITTDGVVKLLDFGIARAIHSGAPTEGMTPGTIAYMSPEQVTSRALDHRTDLWSLGVVLYEMCTGARPFGDENAGAVLYAILNEPAPRTWLRERNVPERLTFIIDRLLAKDPSSRYPTADELIRDLTALSPFARGAGRLRRRVQHAAAALALLGVTHAWSGATRPVVSERRIAAQDAYAQGNRDVLFRTETGRRQALQFFRQAIALDSTYVNAHAGLAHLLVLSSDDPGGTRRARLREAEQAARAAIRLDSLYADAHSALGHVLLFHYQFPEAEREFKRAVDLDPRSPYVREFLVWLYIFMDRPRDALNEARRGVAENPGSPTAIAEEARALLVMRRCDEALQLLDRLSYLQPPPARVASIAAQCHSRQQRWSRAVEELVPVAERNPVLVYPLLGFVLARAGRTERALEIRDTLFNLWRQGTAGAYGLAIVYAGLRDFDRAFEWLDRSIDDRSLRYNIMEPAFQELHRDPRFDAVRHRLGIGVSDR